MLDSGDTPSCILLREQLSPSSHVVEELVELGVEGVRLGDRSVSLLYFEHHVDAVGSGVRRA
jgi:hypothetical protein